MQRCSKWRRGARYPYPPRMGPYLLRAWLRRLDVAWESLDWLKGRASEFAAQLGGNVVVGIPAVAYWPEDDDE
jgi:hypothetical protein